MRYKHLTVTELCAKIKRELGEDTPWRYYSYIAEDVFELRSPDDHRSYQMIHIYKLQNGIEVVGQSYYHLPREWSSERENGPLNLSNPEVLNFIGVLAKVWLNDSTG